ncbi:hypothetical protein ACFL56_01455 [Candidatus Margulisiibacteriota bacterium]
MENILLNNTQYKGCYVTLTSFTDKTVIGSGDDPEKLITDAYSKGYPDAVLVYVPDDDVVSIY